MLTSIGANRRGEVLEEHLAGAGVTLLPGSHSAAAAAITVSRAGARPPAGDGLRSQFQR